MIDLRELSLPQDFSDSPATEVFRRRIGRADAVVAVTSEYNHGYPAALKTAFDSVKHEWRCQADRIRVLTAGFQVVFGPSSN